MTTTTSATAPRVTPRTVADRYVDEVVHLDPFVATGMGLPEGADRMPDLSPAGTARTDDLRRRTLAALDEAEAAAGGRDALDDSERRCARLLRERLTAALALSETGEELRALDTLFSPLQRVRSIFLLMPSATADDWATIGRRLTQVPQALTGLQETLALGLERGATAGPRQVHGVLAQLDQWLGTGSGSAPGARPWFSTFVQAGPDQARDRLDPAAAGANDAVAALRTWLREEYAPATDGTPDAVGRERYRRYARYWTGSDLDLDEVHAWGWSEYARIDAELRAEADRVLPGADPRTAMTHLDEHGEAVDGVEEVRLRLQRMMDDAIQTLDGVHFDLAEPVRRVEAMIAPEGSAAAPYYTRPAVDFSRPGRTWLPTLGRTRFPMWNLISTWYHEGVPGHHLQLAQWVHVAPQLSRYQTSLGSVSSNTEGWALYAERLMDELGFLPDPASRLGYLDAQQLRAVRVVIDTGMHLGLEIPADQGTPTPFAPGERWTPELAREFLGRNSGADPRMLDSEIVRYLGMPGQAISYKLGERAWLAGRDAARRARAARGDELDAKAWHMAALSLGSLGLDDLVDELAAL